MSVARLVLVSYFYPPNYWSGGAARPYWFSRLLPEHGWETWVFAGPGQTVDPSVAAAKQESQNTVIRAGGLELRSSAPPGVSTHLKSIARLMVWPDGKRPWLRNAKQLKELVGRVKPDLMLACAPPFTDLLMVEKVSKATGVDYAIDLWDPWSDDLYDMYPTPVHRWITRRAEKRIFTRAKALFVINQAMQEELSARYPGLYVINIPFGFDPRRVQATALPRAKRFRLVYAGSFFGKHKQAKPLFTELRSIDRSLPVEFVFVGRKTQQVKQEIAKLSGLFPVAQSDQLSHQQAVEACQKAHGLLILITRGPAYHLVSTGKVYEAVGFGRALLGVVPSGTRIWEFLDQHRAYLADPDQRGQVKSAVERMVRDWQTSRLRVPDRQKALRFTWENIVAGLAEQLGHILG